MEHSDTQLIDSLIPTHSELRTLVIEHRDYERQIDDLGSRRWLTDEERLRLAELKKRKLRGRDRIETILNEARRLQPAPPN